MKKGIIALLMVITLSSFVSATDLTGTVEVTTNLTVSTYEITQNQLNPLLNLVFAYGDNVTVDNVIFTVYLDGTAVGNYTVIGNHSTATLPRLALGTHSIRLEVLNISRPNVVDLVSGTTLPVEVTLKATADRDAIAINKGEVGRLTLTITNTGNVPLRVTAKLIRRATGETADSQQIDIDPGKTVEITLSDDPQTNTDYDWVITDGTYTYASGSFRILVYGGGVVPAVPSGGGALPPEVQEYVEKTQELNNVIFYVIGEVFGFPIQLWMPFAALGLYGVVKGDKNLALIGFGFLGFFYFASPWLVAG